MVCAEHFCDLLMNRRAAVIAALHHAGEFAQHVDLGPAQRGGEFVGAADRLDQEPVLAGFAFQQRGELAVGDDVAAAHHLAIGLVGISQPLVSDLTLWVNSTGGSAAMTTEPSPRAARSGPAR